MTATWDCIVVGGGAAGLSAALVLGRARRRTLVVDAGEQSNRRSEGIGGLLGHDGRPPASLYELAHGELGAYPSVELRSGAVVSASRDGEAFTAELADGSRETSRRMLLAPGMDYRVPGLPGVAERFGGSVFHCPFCHGWEHRDGALGVLAGDARGVHTALLLSAWSGDVTLLTDGPSALDPEDEGRLAAAGIAVDERKLSRLEGPDAALSAVAFEDGGERPLTGLLVRVALHQRSALARQLGADIAEPGPVAADAIAVDARFATSVPGLFAAGDASAEMPSVAGAVAAGHTAAAMIVGDLLVVGG